MKIFVISFVGLLSMPVVSLAESSYFQCTLRDFRGGDGFAHIETQRADILGKESLELSFESTISENLQVTGRYSPLLNSVDAMVVDLESNTKSISTDWANSQGEPAHASIVYVDAEENRLILQCAKYSQSPED